MARRRSGAPRGGRRGRPLTLGGLVAVLLVLAAVYATERFHLVPPGTLDSILGEEKTQRQRPIPRPVPDASIDYAAVAAQLDRIRVEEEQIGRAHV